jgi:hypothetical protein
MCGRPWATLTDFARDPETRPLGVTVNFDEPYLSLIFFVHGCGTTIGVPAGELRPLLPPLEGPVLCETEECRHHCLTFSDLVACDRPCRNAPLRRLLADLDAAKSGTPRSAP